MTQKGIRPYDGQKLAGQFEEIDGQNYLVCDCKHCGRLFLHKLGQVGRIPAYDTQYCQNRAAHIRKVARQSGKKVALPVKGKPKTVK